jgi:hypothetical protein
MAKLSIKEKIAVQRDNLSIKKQLQAGGLKVKEKLALQRQWKENLKRLDVKPVKETPDNGALSLIERFVTGAFNNLGLSQFVAVIDDVNGEGATLDQVKVGAKSWAEANQQLIAA